MANEIFRTAPNCPFRIRCNFDQTESKARVSTLVAKHTCLDERDPENTSVPRGEVTKLRFLLDAVPQLMIIDQDTLTKDIIKNIKNRYGQQISIRQAQKVKSTLLSMASEIIGRDLYSRMRGSLGDDAADEEMRRGKRLREDEEEGDAIDPRLYEDPNDQDYQDEQMEGYDDEYFDPYEPLSEHELQSDKMINKPLESATQHKRPDHDEPTAAELRAKAAILFQQASQKFQEATQLHMQASKIFSQATEMEDHFANG